MCKHSMVHSYSFEIFSNTSFILGGNARGVKTRGREVHGGNDQGRIWNSTGEGEGGSSQMTYLSNFITICIL